MIIYLMVLFNFSDMHCIECVNVTSVIVNIIVDLCLEATILLQYYFH